MPTSIASVCLSGSLSDKLRPAAEVGTDRLELFERNDQSFDGGSGDIETLTEGLTPDRRARCADPVC